MSRFALRMTMPLLALGVAACDGSPFEPPYVDATCRAAGEVHELVRLGRGAYVPEQLVIDGEYVYWPSRGGPRRVHRNGGYVEHLVIDGEEVTSEVSVGGIVVDEFYVWHARGGVILRVPKGGGVAEGVASGGSNVRDLLIDEKYLFWVSQAGGLFRIEKRDPPFGAVLGIAQGATAETLAADEERVWWGYRYIEKDGFGFRESWESGLHGLVLHGDYVYGMRVGGSVDRWPRSGNGDLETIRHGNSPLPRRLILHDDRFFWGEGGPDGGYSSMALDGSDYRLTALPSPFMGSAQAIAIDDEAVYLAQTSGLQGIRKLCHGGAP
jgi:hypothetical protein